MEAFNYNFVSGQAPRSTLTFQRDDYQVNVLENVATATFIQMAKGSDGKPLGKTREVRVLEKQGNDWKLVYVHSRTIN